MSCLLSMYWIEAFSIVVTNVYRMEERVGLAQFSDVFSKVVMVPNSSMSGVLQTSQRG